MYREKNNKLVSIYKLLKEDNDTVSGMGGDFVVEDTALNWKLAGLYEPESSLAVKQTEVALRELSSILNNLMKNLELWQVKHENLGASDTVSKEQVAQYIAKSKFGLVRLD